MNQLREALAWLSAMPGEVARLDRWRTLLARAGYLYALLGSVVMLRQAWFSGAWQDWEVYWILCSWAFSGAFEYLRPGPSAFERDSRQRLMSLRDAAASGDNVIAPPFEPQPAPTAQPNRLERQTRIGRFRPPATGSPSIWPVSAALWGSMAVVVALMGSPSSWLFVAVPVLLLGLVGLWRWLLRRRLVTVAADAESLTWRQGKRERRVAWGEIRAFCVLAEPVKWAWRTYHCVYLVYTSDAVLAWEVGGSAPAYLRQDSLQLAGLITAQTGLPLRDLTVAAKAGGFAAPRRPDPSVPAAPQPPRPRRRLLRLAAIPLFIALVVPAVGLAAVTQQGRIYHDRLVGVEAHPPLFRDPLAADDGLWPIRAGSAHQGTVAFEDGAYVLRPQDDAALSAWPTPTFGDVAIEVSVSQQPANYTFTGAGLLLRADDATRRIVVFTITPDGSWRLSTGRYDDDSSSSSIAHGDSDAIHKGSDATNRLSAMLRGASCTLFVNGQFLGTYDIGDPSTGHVGIYASGDVQQAAFTNFAVYPAPPRSSVFAV